MPYGIELDLDGQTMSSSSARRSRPQTATGKLAQQFAKCFFDGNTAEANKLLEQDDLNAISLDQWRSALGGTASTAVKDSPKPKAKQSTSAAPSTVVVDEPTTAKKIGSTPHPPSLSATKTGVHSRLVFRTSPLRKRREQVGTSTAPSESTPLVSSESTVASASILPHPPPSRRNDHQRCTRSSCSAVVRWGVPQLGRGGVVVTQHTPCDTLRVPQWNARITPSTGERIREPAGGQRSSSGGRIRHESSRLYDKLSREERRLSAEVPLWLLERTEYLIEQAQQQLRSHRPSAIDCEGPTVGPENSWGRLCWVHPLPAVAAVIQVQLWVKSRLAASAVDLRRRARAARLHRVPNVSEGQLDYALNILQHTSTKYTDYNSATEAAGAGAAFALLQLTEKASPHPPDPVAAQLMEMFVPRFRNHVGRVAKRAISSFTLQEDKNNGKDGPFGAECSASSVAPRLPSKATEAYRQRKKSTAANTVDESIIKENAAYCLHKFFKMVADRWRYRRKQERLRDAVEERCLEEHVLVLQSFLDVKKSSVILAFHVRQRKRSRAASAVQRQFRLFMCQRRYAKKKLELSKWHEQRVQQDKQRDACRVLLNVLRVLRARAVVSKRKKLLAMKMQYREEAERRQRAQELMRVLTSVLTAIIRRTQRRTKAKKAIEQRIAKEREQERKLQIQEGVPLVQSILYTRRSAQVTRQKQTLVVDELREQLRVKQSVVERVVATAVTKALAQRVQAVTMNFFERCPALWRARCLRKIAKEKKY